MTKYITGSHDIDNDCPIHRKAVKHTASNLGMDHQIDPLNVASDIFYTLWTLHADSMEESEAEECVVDEFNMWVDNILEDNYAEALECHTVDSPFNPHEFALKHPDAGTIGHIEREDENSRWEFRAFGVSYPVYVLKAIITVISRHEK